MGTAEPVKLGKPAQCRNLEGYRCSEGDQAFEIRGVEKMADLESSELPTRRLLEGSGDEQCEHADKYGKVYLAHCRTGWAKKSC